ncbi:hypothetical protein BU23DRAFT_105946 [Bimuria novae-zelandiae CBS 107.79]|uniref:Uncharacterized protein n=1 Tax=Bimuria novae-zelandiae CBS 107.79 TaxID=1447943 RepID=A0A6A5VSA5_9PLEO|nr:hypothetical protein BU23DRAFT_105946 [Bimuria novae-zelandiae CBS 107.79]
MLGGRKMFISRAMIMGLRGVWMDLCHRSRRSGRARGVAWEEVEGCVGGSGRLRGRKWKVAWEEVEGCVGGSGRLRYEGGQIVG